MTDNRQERKGMGKRALLTMYAIMLLCFGVLTWCLALRWIIGGTVPMSNGYETMLLLAWIIMLVSIAVGRRFPHNADVWFPLVGILPPRGIHKQYGPEDNTYHARPAVALAEYTRRSHNDVIRPACTYVLVQPYGDTAIYS